MDASSPLRAAVDGVLSGRPAAGPTIPMVFHEADDVPSGLPLQRGFVTVLVQKNMLPDQGSCCIRVMTV
jgi:hypothetical protein